MAKTDDEQKKQTDDEREKQALIGLRQRTNEAFARRDIAEMGRALSPDFVVTTPDGDLKTRQEEIVKVQTGELNIVSVVQQFGGLAHQPPDLDVRLYDDVERVAIFRGVDKITGKMGAEEVTGDFRFTDVLVKRDGKWQFVASHSVALGRPPEPPPQPSSQPGQSGSPPA
jgi:hypothetical protein